MTGVRLCVSLTFVDTEHELRAKDATPRPYSFRRGLCVYEWDPFSNRYHLIETRQKRGYWVPPETEDQEEKDE